MDIARVKKDDGTKILGGKIDGTIANPWSCEPKAHLNIWGRIIEVKGGWTEEGPILIMAGSVGAMEGPIGAVEIGASIVAMAEVALSNLSNILKSNVWTEGVASGTKGGGIGSVGPSGL